MMISSIGNFSQTKEIWEVFPSQNLEVSITRSLEEAKAVILFIHGGPNLTKKAAIQTQEPFFTDLAEKKFHVIAPYCAYDHLNQPDVDYRDLLDGVAKKIAEKFPSFPLCVISHSYGAHLTGSTLLREGELSRNIKKWVLLSGTTHHAAGNIKRSLSDIVSITGQIPKDEENRIIWNESFLSPNASNLKILDIHEDEISSAVFPLEYDDMNRFSLDGYKKNVDFLNNAIISKALNKKLSVHYQLPSLSHRFPVLIVHPIEDCAVTVDVGLAFFKVLQQNRWPVQFTTEENSPHNWMKKGTPHSEDLSYQQLFGAVNRFISEGALDEREVETAIAMTETYLEKNPDLNFMQLFERFHQNEQITFTSFLNDGLALARDEKVSSGTKIVSQGIDATRQCIELFVDPFKKTLGELELMIEETNKEQNKTDQQTDLEAYAYYAKALSLLNYVADRMRNSPTQDL